MLDVYQPLNSCRVLTPQDPVDATSTATIGDKPKTIPERLPLDRRQRLIEPILT